MLNTKPGWVQIMFWVKNGRRHQVFIDSFISYVESPLQERMQRVTVSRTTVKVYMEWSSVVKIRQNIGVPTGMCIYLLGDAEIVKVFLCLILICCWISFKLLEMQLLQHREENWSGERRWLLILRRVQFALTHNHH